MYSVLSGSSGRQSEGFDASSTCCIVGALAAFCGGVAAFAAKARAATQKNAFIGPPDPGRSSWAHARTETAPKSKDMRFDFARVARSAQCERYLMGRRPSMPIKARWGSPPSARSRHPDTAVQRQDGSARTRAARCCARIVRRIHEQERAAVAGEVGIFADVAGFGTGELHQPLFHAFQPVRAAARFQLAGHEVTVGRAHVFGRRAGSAEFGLGGLRVGEIVKTRNDVMPRIESAQRGVALLEKAPVTVHRTLRWPGRSP